MYTFQKILLMMQAPLEANELTRNNLEIQEAFQVLTEKIVCISCKRIPNKSPFLVCETGHICCLDCKWTTCPVCLVKLQPDNSVLIELILRVIPHQCQYLECNGLFSRDKLIDHERQCEYRTVSCPNKKCGVSTPLSSIISHLNTCNSDNLIKADEENSRYRARLNTIGWNNDGSFEKLMIFLDNGSIFILRILRDPLLCKWNFHVNVLSDMSPAESLSFELSIAKRGWGPNNGSAKQTAAGPQGPGGSLNQFYSARELLKALESDES